jgi:hypothetical protein
MGTLKGSPKPPRALAILDGDPSETHPALWPHVNFAARTGRRRWDLAWLGVTF